MNDGTGSYNRFLSFLGVVLLVSCPLLAEDTPSFDLSVKTGLVTGKLIQLKDDNSSGDENDYGGVPFAVGYHHELSRLFALQWDLVLVVDFTNSQLSRTGLDFTGFFHILGASRWISRDRGIYHLKAQEPFALSVLVRTGFHRYTASNQGVSVNGSTLDVSAGGQMRADVSDRTALFVEGLTTVGSVVASTERIKSRVMAVSVGLRVFF